MQNGNMLTTTRAKNRVATLDHFIAMIRLLPMEYQYRVLYSNPEFCGNVLFIPKDGNPANPQEVLICDTEEKMQIACDFKLNHVIKGSRSIRECFMHINKPYRLQLLRIFSNAFDINGEYEKILKDAWISTEFPHMMRIDNLIRMFDAANRDLLMSEEDKARFNQLSDTIKVYRGYSETKIKEGTTKRKGLAWTDEKKMAVWFATRWDDPDPKLMTGTIRKKFVYMYTNDRGERELVLNPRHLTNVTITDVGRFD